MINIQYAHKKEKVTKMISKGYREGCISGEPERSWEGKYSMKKAQGLKSTDCLFWLEEMMQKERLRTVTGSD